MALADTSVARQREAYCVFGRIIDNLDKDDRQTLSEWVARMDGKTFGAPTIATGLGEAGFPVGPMAITKHLRGLCCCTGRDDFHGVKS